MVLVPIGLALGLVILVAVLAGGPSCSGGAGADPAPSGQARKGIPSNYLQLYRAAARRSGVPWSVLAAIGSVETDHGRLRARGVHSGANFAGAAGPMQFGVGGLAGNTWGRYGVDADHDGRKNVYDPADAIPAAAHYLKANGAPKDLDRAIFAYNHAGWYVAKVKSTAADYAGQSVDRLVAESTAAGGVDCGSLDDVQVVPGSKARILPSGEAAAPAEAPAAVKNMIAAGNRINAFPYSWGGGHGAVSQTMNRKRPRPSAAPGQQENGGPGYDCSSATSYVLFGGGFGEKVLHNTVPTSGSLAGLGDPGRGKWVTWYANGSHVYIEVAGIYFDTAAGKGRKPNPPSTGPRWTPDDYGPGGFTPRHPAGL